MKDFSKFVYERIFCFVFRLGGRLVQSLLLLLDGLLIVGATVLREHLKSRTQPGELIKEGRKESDMVKHCRGEATEA